MLTSGISSCTPVQASQGHCGSPSPATARPCTAALPRQPQPAAAWTTGSTRWRQSSVPPLPASRMISVVQSASSMASARSRCTCTSELPAPYLSAQVSSSSACLIDPGLVCCMLLLAAADEFKRRFHSCCAGNLESAWDQDLAWGDTAADRAPLRHIHLPRSKHLKNPVLLLQ